MAPHNETLWAIEPHTKAKHEILRRYLGAWLPILGSKIPSIVYIDGFCGPGRYTGGEEGSPIIALEVARRQSALQTSEVTFIFIDERADRIQHLENELSTRSDPPNFHVSAIVNEFETTMTGILDDLDRDGRQPAPTFAFVDPFGFKGASFAVVQRLLSNPRTEVLLNMMVEPINRFAQHPSPIDQQHIRSLLGASQQEVEQAITSSDRVAAFRELYQTKLLQHARFVRFFAMQDDRNKIIYYLFFATNHPLGHAKIKEVFWKVDPQSGFKFSDRTDPNQMVLLEIDPAADLARHLKSHFAGTRQSAQEITTYVEDKTAYTKSHAKKAMIQLEEQADVTVEATKSNGKRRLKSTFPDGTIVHFL